MLINFKKAFDSISWVFINKVLKHFNFGKTFIKCITILNPKIKGTVIQCGNLSKFFDIKRGCRQGDPISSYLFILCAEILKLFFIALIHPIQWTIALPVGATGSRQTPEKDVLYIIPAGPVSSVHSLGGASYLLPV